MSRKPGWFVRQMKSVREGYLRSPIPIWLIILNAHPVDPGKALEEWPYITSEDALARMKNLAECILQNEKNHPRNYRNVGGRALVVKAKDALESAKEKK